ncbi:hypothetical protein GGI08_006062 [Coemansia sp. S2]|nr:hypothetical protein GGI08_006062 [Coemansia sp. S2]KAJ2067481.1 hypothetical protein GGH13_005293 [Coemansia sp. S155-1]
MYRISRAYVYTVHMLAEALELLYPPTGESVRHSKASCEGERIFVTVRILPATRALCPLLVPETHGGREGSCRYQPAIARDYLPKYVWPVIAPRVLISPRYLTHRIGSNIPSA